MTYWRMQLHPNNKEEALKYTVESITAGYIGLDFSDFEGDMLTVSREDLPQKHRSYWAFAREMKIGDYVLVSSHNYPFALVRVKGRYNYIRSIAPEIGVWFRHFREIDDVRYYGDFIRGVKRWKYIPMTIAIEPLREPKSASYQLIEKWLVKT